MSAPHAEPLALLDAPVCCSADVPTPATRFHCALSVADLARSIEFYRILFGTRPAKQHDDYAKFELTQPPLVFSLIPQPPGTGSTLRHFALPVHHPSEVEHLGTRLATAGLSVTWRRDAVIDDARQSAAEVTDPDGNLWRIGCRLENVAELAADNPRRTPIETARPVDNIGWEHRIVHPCPQRIPHADGSVDFVRLEGTFNADLSPTQRSQLLAAVRRVLKPGGELFVHGLAADRALPACPALPGVAALVRRVPVETEPLDELLAAGFVDLEITRLPAKPAFRWGDAELRELKLTARTPAGNAGGRHPVMYRGPFARLVTDEGRCYVRGVATLVDDAAYAALQRDPWRGQFLLLDATDVADAARDCAPAVAGDSAQ
jgi:catechol 2,3-dioxygenase-like lactoylglutathione lyase family enzyme